MAASRDSFRFLVLSRGLRSVAIIYMTLAAPLYLDFINISLPQIGLIYVAVMLFAGALNMALGMLGDRYGYKKALLLAEILPMLAAFTIGFTENTALLIAAVILGGVGGVAGGIRGTFTPGTTALVASSYPDDKERVKRLSSLTKIGSIASILGALMLIGHTYLTGVFGIAGAYRILFAVAGAVMALSFISLLFVQSDKRPEKTTTMMKRSSLIYTLKVSGANMINGAAIGISMPLFPLILGIAFHIPIELLSLTVGLVYIPSYVGVAFGSYFAGRYSGRHNIVKVASYARISSGILLLGMSAVISMAYLGFGPSLYLLALVTLIYLIRSTIAGFGNPSINAVNIKGIHGEDYGTAVSIQGVAMSASMASSGFSGFLIEDMLPSPLLIGGALQIISGIVYFGFFRKRD